MIPKPELISRSPAYNSTATQNGYPSYVKKRMMVIGVGDSVAADKMTLGPKSRTTQALAQEVTMTTQTSPTSTPYQLLGPEKIRQLADTFYDVMDELTEAEAIRKMHSANLDTIKEKLNDYLTGWMGGPPIYREKYGTICLTEPHKPYQITSQHRDQWLHCMDEALVRIGASDEIVSMLKGPMYDMADFVKNSD